MSTCQASYYEQRVQSSSRQLLRAHQRWKQGSQEGLRCANKYLNLLVQTQTIGRLGVVPEDMTVEPLVVALGGEAADEACDAVGVAPPTVEDALGSLYVQMSELVPVIQAVLGAMVHEHAPCMCPYDIFLTSAG